MKTRQQPDAMDPENLLDIRLGRLVAMIADFQNVVAQANCLLQKYLGLANPLYWRQANIPQEGFLGSGQSHQYYFHGGGCYVETPEWVIDWDYGYDGRIDGFDTWRLYAFAEQTSHNYLDFKDKRVLEETFQEAARKGLIHQPYLSLQDWLYYLK
jgi:hypothetical protein